MGNELLRKARDERGWTQQELADKLQIGESTVRSWERGDHSPSLKLRSRLCDLFNTTPEQLGLVQHSTQQFQQEEIHIPQEETQIQIAPKMGEQDPNRSKMLKRVKTRWISGVLDHSLSLYQGTFIHLPLQECPTAVGNPWSMIAQESNLPSRSLSPETGILDVYDETDGGLLILGEPGAGKTTLLLELIRNLLERANSDEMYPMPVVFNLSAWAEKRSLLPVWLSEELNDK